MFDQNSYKLDGTSKTMYNLEYKLANTIEIVL